MNASKAYKLALLLRTAILEKVIYILMYKLSLSSLLIKLKVILAEKLNIFLMKFDFNDHIFGTVIQKDCHLL